jgi:hypothetical protein
VHDLPAALLLTLRARGAPQRHILEHVLFARDASVFARRLVKLNGLLVVACHWIGCLWLLCGRVGARAGRGSWLAADQGGALHVDHADLSGACGYVRSVYWALVAMSTVGYGDILPTNALETLFTTVALLGGGLMLPAIVGGLASMIDNLDLAVKTHRGHMASLRAVRPLLLVLYV